MFQENAPNNVTIMMMIITMTVMVTMMTVWERKLVVAVKKENKLHFIFIVLHTSN